MTDIYPRYVVVAVLWNVAAAVSMQPPAALELLRREVSPASPKSLSEAGAGNQGAKSATGAETKAHPQMHMAGGPPGHWEAVKDPNVKDGGLDKMEWVTDTPIASQDPEMSGSWRFEASDNYASPKFHNSFQQFPVEHGHWTWLPGKNHEEYVRGLRPGPDWPLGHLSTHWHNDHQQIVFQRVDPENGQEPHHAGPPDLNHAHPSHLKEHLQVDLAKRRLHELEQDREHPLPEGANHVAFNPYLARDVSQKNFDYDVGQNGELGTWKYMGEPKKQASQQQSTARNPNWEAQGMNIHLGKRLPAGWRHDTGNFPEHIQKYGPETGTSHGWLFRPSPGSGNRGYYSMHHYGVETATAKPTIIPPEEHWSVSGGEGEPSSSRGHFSTGYHNPWSQTPTSYSYGYGPYGSSASSFPETDLQGTVDLQGREEEEKDTESIDHVNTVLPSLR